MTPRTTTGYRFCKPNVERAATHDPATQQGGTERHSDATGAEANRFAFKKPRPVKKHRRIAFDPPANQPPTVAIGVSTPAGETQACSFIGSITDPDGPSPYTLLIDWGDDSSESRTLGGPMPYLAFHTYAETGVYTIVATATDGAGASGSTTLIVTVPRVAAVEWIEADSPLDGNPAAGGGLRIFPDDREPEPEEDINYRLVKVRATLNYPMDNVRVYFRAFDVDDPTSNEAPVDAEFDAQGNPLLDNRGSHLDHPAFVMTSGGVAEIPFYVSMQPGDNHRFAASFSQTLVQQAQPKQYDGTFARIWIGAVPLPAPGFPQIKVTELLTVWRRLHVEVDSMGPEPAGTQFEADDLLRGDVPDPDISALPDAFRPAFIAPLRDTGEDNPNMPWRHNFDAAPGVPDGDAVLAYFLIPNGQRGTRTWERPSYWVVYIAGIYELSDFGDNDDPVVGNREWGIPGATGAGPGGLAEMEVSYVFQEVVRDSGAQWGWTDAQKTLVGKAVALHELGHHFLGNLHSPPNAQGNPADVMWAPQNDAEEDKLKLVPLQFTNEHLAIIRGVQFP